MAIDLEELTMLGAPVAGALAGLVAPLDVALPWWIHLLSSLTGFGVGVLFAWLAVPRVFRLLDASEPKHLLAQGGIIALLMLTPIVMWALVGMVAARIAALTAALL